MRLRNNRSRLSRANRPTIVLGAVGIEGDLSGSPLTFRNAHFRHHSAARTDMPNYLAALVVNQICGLPLTPAFSMVVFRSGDDAKAFAWSAVAASACGTVAANPRSKTHCQLKPSWYVASVGGGWLGIWKRYARLWSCPEIGG
jgi:hypothetical protein